jgi:zinc transporter
MTEPAPWLESRIGLLCGFVFQDDAPPRPLNDQDVPAALASNERLWLHFNLSDMRARHFVARMDRLAEGLREHLLERPTHLRIETHDDALAGELGDLQIDPADESDVVDTFGFVLRQDILVTVRRHPLKSLDRLRDGLGRSKTPSSPSQAFAELIDHFSTDIRALVEEHSDLVDTFEDRILAGSVERIGDRLGPIRRLLVRMRRRMTAERQLLACASAHPPEWFTPPDRQSLRDALDQLDGVAQDLDLVADRARLLQEEIGARLTEETNRNLFFLSVVTALILPVTLITGIFGMNVGGLPWVDDPGGFAWVCIVMLATLAASALFLRRRKLF